MFIIFNTERQCIFALMHMHYALKSKQKSKHAINPRKCAKVIVVKNHATCIIKQQTMNSIFQKVAKATTARRWQPTNAKKLAITK